MKAFETTLFAFTLLTVPALAWVAGRAMGKRDWPIAAVVVASCFVTLIPHAIRYLVLASADPRPFGDAMQAFVRRAFDNPEVGLFFLALGVFMTMLGWTSTPVAAK